MPQTAPMNNVKPLRRLAYCSLLTALARTLHISGALRKAYYYCVAPPGGILRTKVCGIEAAFYARTAEELRAVEMGPLGEKDFLSVLMSTLRPGDVFWDIGSNIGLFAIPVAKVVGPQGEVVAFEPEKESCQNLQLHVALNRLSNVRVIQKALGSQNGKGTLFVKGRASPTLIPERAEADRRQLIAQERISQGSMQLSESVPVPESGLETVDIVQGDWFRATENLPVPRAVKIDVEGYEYSVLRGLQQTLAHPACELLCCEIHPSFLPAEVDVATIVEFVKSLGFTRIDMPLRLTRIHMVAAKRESSHEAR